MTRITATSTSHVTSDISPIILRETSTTRLIFSPTWVEISSNPLRGGFRFQRKGPNDNWDDIDHQALSTLHKDEGYELNLKGEEITLLFSHLEEIKAVLERYGHSYGSRTFVLSEENTEGVLLQIGDSANRKLIVQKLRELENQNFENLSSVVGSARLESVIEEFDTNIQNADESYWQGLFEEYPWILQQLFSFPVIYLNGETLLGGKNTSGRNGQGGVVTDFLFKNGSNGSFAVVEIKTPDCELAGSLYRGQRNTDHNNETYEIHGNLSGGLVQLENQIFTALRYFRSMLGENYENIDTLNPHGILIAGSYSSLSLAQQKSFDLFRKSLGKNQIFTFDEVLQKLRSLKVVYEN